MHLVQDSTQQKLDQNTLEVNLLCSDHLTKWCRWRDSVWSLGPPRFRRWMCPVAHGGASRVGHGGGPHGSTLQNRSKSYVHMPNKRTNTKSSWNPEKNVSPPATFFAIRIQESSINIWKFYPCHRVPPTALANKCKRLNYWHRMSLPVSVNVEQNDSTL